jgi:hypothetical protein
MNSFGSARLKASGTVCSKKFQPPDNSSKFSTRMRLGDYRVIMRL